MGVSALGSIEPFGLTSIPLPVLMGVLRAVGDRLHEGIYILDAQDRLRYANPAALRLFGLQRESQVRGREIGGLIRRLGDAVDDRRHNVLDEAGNAAAQLGLVVRTGSRPAPSTVRLSSSASLGGEAFGIQDVDTLDFDGDALGCVAVRVFSTAPTVEVEAVARDLGRLMARVTRPEDMVVRVRADTVVLFLHAKSLAGVKSIAERITARGRREIREEFRVGVALGGAGDTAATLVQDAQSDYYTTKPRMRGRVAPLRSGT